MSRESIVARHTYIHINLIVPVSQKNRTINALISIFVSQPDASNFARDIRYHTAEDRVLWCRTAMD
jgi:hypothetical protein